MRVYALDMEKADFPRSLLESVDSIVHCAGRAHVMNEDAATAVSRHRKANTETTERLARAAADAGVRRFVFLSSIGVHGGFFGQASPITESSAIQPVEEYARSKAAAETRLEEVGRSSGMEVVIVRPCLVAGPAAPGNLQRLARLVAKGFPLPVPAVDNARSFVGLSNLVELLILCTRVPAAAGKTFVAADRDVVSTREVLEAVAEGVGKQVRLFKVPGRLFRAGATLMAKGALYDKIYGDLVVDASRAESLLGWRRAVPTLESMRQVGRGR